MIRARRLGACPVVVAAARDGLAKYFIPSDADPDDLLFEPQPMDGLQTNLPLAGGGRCLGRRGSRHPVMKGELEGVLPLVKVRGR